MGSCSSKRKVQTSSPVAYASVEFTKSNFDDGKLHITEECNGLKHNLAAAQKEREAAQEEVNHLNIRVQSLENLVRDLQDAADKVGKLENEKKEAVQQLHQTRGQVNALQQNHQSLESEHVAVVESLRRQVRELEDRRRAEEERGEDLALQVARLQKEAENRQLVVAPRQEQQKSVQPSIVQESFVSIATAPILAQVSAKNQSSGLRSKPQHKKTSNYGKTTIHHSTKKACSNTGNKEMDTGQCDDPELNELALKLSCLVDEASECESVEGEPLYASHSWKCTHCKAHRLTH